MIGFVMRPATPATGGLAHPSSTDFGHDATLQADNAATVGCSHVRGRGGGAPGRWCAEEIPASVRRGLTIVTADGA